MVYLCYWFAACFVFLLEVGLFSVSRCFFVLRFVCWENGVCYSVGSLLLCWVLSCVWVGCLFGLLDFVCLLACWFLVDVVFDCFSLLVWVCLLVCWFGSLGGLSCFQLWLT